MNPFHLKHGNFPTAVWQTMAKNLLLALPSSDLIHLWVRAGELIRFAGAAAVSGTAHVARVVPASDGTEPPENAAHH